MTRRIVSRTAAAAVAGGVLAAAGLAPALPALAHGAPVQPISRTAACAPDNADAGTAACRAALKANGAPLGAFDNLRVPGVDGRDRQVIPDGKLCSGGLPAFKGLDLARADWPATRLTAGGPLTVQYRTTIPHRGSFRIYLTKQGYASARPLTWNDLAAKPILTADNPPLRDGSYRMSGKLPADRSGRHVLFTIWQTTSTPDTYYSCSDVILKAAATANPPKAVAGKTPTRSAKPSASSSTKPGALAAPADQGGPTAGAAAPAAHQSWLRRAGDTQQITLSEQLISAALIVVVGVAGAWAFIRIRRVRATQRIHRRSQNR